MHKPWLCIVIGRGSIFSYTKSRLVYAMLSLSGSERLHIKCIVCKDREAFAVYVCFVFRVIVYEMFLSNAVSAIKS